VSLNSTRPFAVRRVDHSVPRSEEEDERLPAIMRKIHEQASHAATKVTASITSGANIAGLVKVADAMLPQGVV
jgi:glutamate dehydrogenase/leucine dehydrogenase